MYGSDDINNLKESFTIMKAITIRTTTLKMTILLYVTVYVCKVYCLKKPYNKPLINLDRLVIAGKYQTSVFYVRTSPCGLAVRTVKTSVFYVRTSPCGLAVRAVKTSVFYVRTSPCGLGPYCQNLGLLCTDLAMWPRGPYCQDLGPMFSRNDRTLG